MPVPHDDSGTFCLVNRLSMKAGTVTQRRRRPTPYDRSAARRTGASSASSPAGTTGPAPDVAGGAASVGAGIGDGGAASVGAGIPPAGGAAFCARATDAVPERSNRRAAAQRVRVIVCLRLGSMARDYTHGG